MCVCVCVCVCVCADDVSRHELYVCDDAVTKEFQGIETPCCNKGFVGVVCCLRVLSLSEKKNRINRIKFRANRVCKLCLRHADCFRYLYS